MKNIKGFLLGVACTLLIISLGTTAYAAVTGSTIDIVSGIKLFLHGEELTTADANGEVVEPFIHNGTTYVPVRGLSEALGKAVAWDSESQSVYIDEPLPAEERLSISKIIVSDSCIWYGSYTTVLDFTNCQMTVEGDDWQGAGSYTASYLPSEKQTVFFEAVAEYEMLRWSDDGWLWYGPGMYMDITDQVFYSITIIFEDGTEQKCSGYTVFPQNWNEMSAAFYELSGWNVLPDKAPALLPDEMMNIFGITVKCATVTEDTYRWDAMNERISHSYLDKETGKTVWRDYHPDRAQLLALFDAIREYEVMRWDDPDWPWRDGAPDDVQYEYQIHVDYYSDVPLQWEEGLAYPAFYYSYDITVGGEAGFPENWEEMQTAFRDILDALASEE